jgi:hypothetical protein
MKKLLILMTLLSGTYCSAQSVTTRNMVWSMLNVNYKLTPGISAFLDAQHRYEYTDGDVFQWLVRPSATYKTDKGWLYTIGIAHFRLYPNPNGLPARPEWRPWIEFGRKFEFAESKQILYPRIRFEQRFIREYEGTELSDELTLHSFRVRIRTDYTYQFGGADDKKWSVLAGDEIFFQQKPDGFSSYDQNRAWIGLGYKVNSTLTFQLTYVNLHQQRNSSSSDVLHIIRPTIVLNFATAKANPAVK